MHPPPRAPSSLFTLLCCNFCSCQGFANHGPAAHRIHVFSLLVLYLVTVTIAAPQQKHCETAGRPGALPLACPARLFRQSFMFACPRALFEGRLTRAHPEPAMALSELL
jgi:hypothetical protein